MKENVKFRVESFEIITTFSYKGKVIKSIYIAMVMAFVSVSIHHARMQSTFFGVWRASWRNIILENINQETESRIF